VLIARGGINSLNGLSMLSQAVTELHLAFNLITDVSDLLRIDNLRVPNFDSNNLADLESVDKWARAHKCRRIHAFGSKILECKLAKRSTIDRFTGDDEIFDNSLSEFNLFFVGKYSIVASMRVLRPWPPI
jgi:hypothetical protein